MANLHCDVLHDVVSYIQAFVRLIILDFHSLDKHRQNVWINMEKENVKYLKTFYITYIFYEM